MKSYKTIIYMKIRLKRKSSLPRLRLLRNSPQRLTCPPSAHLHSQPLVGRKPNFIFANKESDLLLSSFSHY